MTGNKLPPLVLLAAGRSLRMGFPKGIIGVNGKTLIERQIQRVFEADIGKIIIVVGFNKETYRPILKNLKKKHAAGLLIVENKKPERGQFSSLQTGLAQTENSDAFVLPLDTLCPTPEVFRKLHESSRCKAGCKAVIPSYLDKGGHPVLLSNKFIVQLLKLDPEKSRLDDEIKNLDADTIEHVAVNDPLICLNINNPEDLSDSP